MELTERDREIVAYVARYGPVKEEHVRGRFFGSKSAAYRRLGMLVDQGLLRHKRVLHNQPGVYWASETGIGFAGLDLRPARVDLKTIEHHLAVVDLSEKLLGEQPDGARWITEREILRQTMASGRDEESGEMEPGAERGRTPDGILISPERERIAIELELSPKRKGAYDRILDDLVKAKGKRWDKVMFFFTSERSREKVAEMAEGYGLGDFFEFRKL